MLTDLDAELFPDDCDVVEIPHHNLYVYCILKNGSSTLYQIAEKNNYKIFQKEQIHQLESVDVMLREPRQRYTVGVDMFVKLTKRDNPDLDIKTCLWFANRYSFLNRHYITQFHWLLNLAKFINPSCKINFHDWAMLSAITLVNDKPKRAPVDPKIASMIQSYLPQKELWLLLDDILLGLKGQSLTWNEIKQIYKAHPCRPLQKLEKSIQLCDVLR